MIKFVVNILMIIMVVGISGCSSEEDYSEKIEQMTQYVKDKYNEDFEFINFTPAARGFNDGMNYSNLSLKMVDKEIYTNVRETVSEPEEYYDDFINNYSAYLIKDSIDYSGITDLNAGKLFVSTRLLSSEYENLKAGEYEITNKQFYNLRCIISIKEEPKEENLKEIYSVYEQWRNLRLDFEIDTGKFWVSFGGDLEKNKMFVNNHMPMVGYQEWSTYDKTITHYIKVVDDSLSYEEFCSELKKNEINSNHVFKLIYSKSLCRNRTSCL